MKMLENVDANDLFVTKAHSAVPPRAFKNIPDVPVFIVPGLIPSISTKYEPLFGGESLGSNSQRLTSLPVPSNLSSDSAQQTAISSSLPSHIPADVDLAPSKYTYGQLSHPVQPGGFDLKNPTSALTALLETSVKDNDKRDGTEFSNRRFDSAISSKNSFAANHKTQQPVPMGPGSPEQPNYLEPNLKNYLDGLSDNITKLNVNDTVSQSSKPSQFTLQQSVTPSQQTLNSFQHNQNIQPMPQLNKSSLPHSSSHSSGHAIQHSAPNTQSHQPAATLPPGMPHFISQFAPPAYHMFNLPGGSGATPTLFDLDHLQLIQQQQRMIYDMHIQQQAATTAQSHLTSNSDSASTSKTPSHNLTGSIGHVTAPSPGIRPDMLTPAMGHTPQMVAPGHPYFPYPGFVVMVSFEYFLSKTSLVQVIFSIHHDQRF